MAGWLERLSARELALVWGAILLGGAAAIYLLVVDPLQDRRLRAAQDLQAARETAHYLAAQRSTHAQLLAGGAAHRPTATTAAPQSLAALEDALRGTPLAAALDRMAPQGDDLVTLDFEDAGYVVLMRWLAQTGLDRRVRDLSVIADDRADRVDVQLTVDLDGAPE